MQIQNLQLFELAAVAIIAFAGAYVERRLPSFKPSPGLKIEPLKGPVYEKLNCVYFRHSDDA